MSDSYEYLHVTYQLINVITGSAECLKLTYDHQCQYKI